MSGVASAPMLTIEDRFCGPPGTGNGGYVAGRLAAFLPTAPAIEAPRVASYSFPSSFAPFEFFPARLAVEGRIAQATRDDLAARGHEIKDWPDVTWLAGSVEAVMSDPQAGLVRAGADPRRPAYAIAG